MDDLAQTPTRRTPPPERPATGPAMLASLESSCDLLGAPCPERLVVDRHRLAVTDFEGNPRRQWRLTDIDGFRLEEVVGSCFLQGQMAGEWTDLFRRPGEADPALEALVDRLNALRRGEGEFDSGSEELPLRGDRESGASTAEPVRGWAFVRRLVGFLRPFRGGVLILLALSSGAAAIEVVPPMLQRALVDDVLQVDASAGQTGQLLLLLAAIVGGLMLVRVGATVVSIWKGRVSSRIGTTMTSELRNQMVAKLNELPLAYFDRNQVGVLMSRVAYDTETLHTLVYHITSGFLLQAMQLLGIGAALVYLNPKLALVTLLPMPLILAGSWYFARHLQPRYNHYWDAVGRQASALMGMLSGIRVVKAFVQEEREVQRFSDSSRRLRDSREVVDVSGSTFTSLMGLVFAAGVLGVWYLGGRDVLFGAMSLGSLMAFLAYLAMFYTPLTSIAESASWLSNFFTTSRRIFDLLDTPSELDQPAAVLAPVPRDFQGRIEFRDVSFGYDKNRPVLRNVSFTIEPGEMVGIVGRSGSGKSTLVSLIGRLYDVDAGQILLDGVDTRRLHPRELRRALGMVLQEPFLFRGTVARNIAYGSATAEPEAILRAARQADAHEFIMRKPLAYEAPLGEGGSGLSGGERQRLSIARALLVEPSILILDEATASVDAESERAICDAVGRYSRRRTTLVIAHRLSTLQITDRLLVFDQGRLIEQGTHRELLSRGGLYSMLASIQSNLKENRRRVESLLGPGSFAAQEAAQDGLADDAQAAGTEADEEAATEAPAAEEPLVWLEPATAVLEADGPASLRLGQGRACVSGVFAVRTFPASRPEGLLSLRHRDPSSGREIEIGLIRDLAQWPAAVTDAVRQSLARRYLFRPVREIRQIRTQGSLLVLSVVTDAGPQRLELEKRSEGFPSFGHGGLLLVDPRGAYYVVPDRASLPRRQQRRLALYFGE